MICSGGRKLDKRRWKKGGGGGDRRKMKDKGSDIYPMGLIFDTGLRYRSGDQTYRLVSATCMTISFPGFMGLLVPLCLG